MGLVVLIVDEDLGFVFWLGQIFSEAGCRALPALNYRQALLITATMPLQIDVVVIDPEIEGTLQIIQTISKAQRDVKIVAIGNPDSGAGGEIHTHATLERPASGQPVLHHEWLERVRGILPKLRTAGGK